jgi:iron-sulfur cluster insertion protein
MAPGIVHGLEIVQVEIGYRERAPVAAAPFGFPAGDFQKIARVPEPGQEIDPGQLPLPDLCALQTGKHGGNDHKEPDPDRCVPVRHPKLRVFVTGGGCSGFQYGFTFDEVTNDDDTAMVKNGVTLLIDPMSYQYLVGAEIDYTEGLEGAQFVIKNPNATTTCGCGSSFSA